MLKSKLSPKITTDENYYFFSMLSDRFAPLNDIWAKKLQERFGHKFKPISLLMFHHNKIFEEENFVVFNNRLEQIYGTLNRTDIIDMRYQEDLNKEFSKSPEMISLIDDLVKKQGKVFILAFSSVWLKPQNENVVILGPNPEISEYFDSKHMHSDLFSRLGLPVIPTTIYKNISELRSKQKEFPFFISALWSNGGFESKIIMTKQDLAVFYSNLRPVNKKSPLIVTKYLDDIVLSPNTNAIVTGPNKAVTIHVTDQIMRSNAYMGNIYPSKASKSHKKQMIEMTEQVGRHMGSKGFRGLFGLDFLITKSGKCYPTDLNPRRQGGYYCNVSASPIDIVELELALAMGEQTPAVDYDDFQVDYCWAHSKLSPYYSNSRLRVEFCDGEPREPFEKIGASHRAIYYPKDHTIIFGNPGFYLTSGNDYDELIDRLHKEIEITISTSYDLYHK
ncbi:MAG: ATP-grasp domain-containing protein [Candidatus Nomurabacteria bacterium]|jgi:predicted ATP-grasp superfamily ATP-dependent carboligase|nr:ATP-grasp domain-containing protein [Candidatus Nomurabacteria bacterium]